MTIQALFERRFGVMAAFVAAAALGGCTVGPNYQTPAAEVSDTFDTGPALLPTAIIPAPPTTQATTTQPTAPATHPQAALEQETARAPSQPVDLEKWWTSLGDAELDGLIDRAMRANLDLAMAAARLQQARSLFAATADSGLPALDLSGSGARGSGSNNTKGRVGAPLNAGTNTAGYKEIDYVAGFDASWEIDLFGGLRRGVEAAAADTQVADEEYKQMIVSVLAEVTRSYVEARSLQLRLRIAQENASAMARTVHLVRERYDRGLGNELDVVLAERQLSAAQARLAPLDAAVRQAQRRIAVLIGDRPESLYAELQKAGPIPAMAANVDVGVPPELIRRRPDIRQAERQLAAATARIGVATASLFPQVGLTGGIGLQGQGLGISPLMHDLIWSAGPIARWQLLDFGRLDSLVLYQEYRTKERLLAYRKTVLAAIEEVEDAMAGFAAERNRLSQLSVAVASSERAVNLATQRYDLGVTDFLNVLDAQRQLYELQDQLAASQQAATVQLVSLYKSLGGGWESFGDVPSPRAPKPAILAAGAQLVAPNK